MMSDKSFGDGFDDFPIVIGGGTLDAGRFHADLPIPEGLCYENELDKSIARLLILNPHLDKFVPEKNLAILSDAGKQRILQDMREYLGITPTL